MIQEDTSGHFVPLQYDDNAELTLDKNLCCLITMNHIYKNNFTTNDDHRIANYGYYPCPAIAFILVSYLLVMIPHHCKIYTKLEEMIHSRISSLHDLY